MLGTLTFKSFVKYAAFPQIWPRLETVFTSGFQYIAYFIALVYNCVRLLPDNHPYVNISNVGRFGIRHVIAEAANNLVINPRNIDQLIMFFCVIIGLVLMLVQVGLLGMSFVVQPVMASMPTSFSGFFITPDPTNDIAHILMDMVFGIPDMFNSCVAQGIPCQDGVGDEVIAAQGPNAGASIVDSLGFPFPIHNAMHQMFQLYSIGLLVIATLITIYFLITVVAETAQTGTAFGKRFNKVWAPVRLVMAFGLLIPVGHGLNSSQYIVLYAAKFGSGFATNGWTLFNSSLTGNYGEAMGELDLTSAPNVPEVGGLLQFFYVARTCAHVEKLANNRDIKMYLVKGPTPTGPPPFLEITGATGAGGFYDDMINFADGDTSVFVRFGVNDKTSFPHHRGNVFPYCGEVNLELTDPRPVGDAEAGVVIMQQFYWFMLKELWFNAFEGGLTGGENYPLNTAQKRTKWDEDPDALLPETSVRTQLQDFYLEKIENDALFGSPFGPGAIDAMASSGRFSIDPVLKEKGWAGAAIWYNKIAELNGALTTAVLNIPLPTKYPDLMEYVQAKKKQHDENVPLAERFNPKLADGEFVPPRRAEDGPMMGTLWTAFQFWQEGTGTPHASVTGNAAIDAINALFGTEGLYNIRRNPDTHPLAQLVGVGRSLIESSIRNLTVAVAGGVAGVGLNFIDEFLGKTASIAATFLVTFAMIGITAGFVLFYIVPFLPFIYFFFAVVGWIKGIFEAMVGAPLWALAHIRIDGEGLAGQAAVSGYFLIFEIFLRPILILFGILASISIFSALVSVLHQIFDLVVSNIGGYDIRGEVEGVTGDGKTIPTTIEFMRSSIDEFFFTVVYTIIVYLMGMASFKLIDLIPNNILRWMGQSVATFNDQREDAAQALVGKATIGAQQTSSALGGGLKGIAGAAG